MLEEVVALCRAMGAGGLTASGSTGGVSSFTAGDLTIRRESGGNPGAKSLTEQAEGLLSPWLKDSGFAFRGVEG